MLARVVSRLARPDHVSPVCIVTYVAIARDLAAINVHAIDSVSNIDNNRYL